jgi:ribosomal protein L37E
MEATMQKDRAGYEEDKDSCAACGYSCYDD